MRTLRDTDEFTVTRFPRGAEGESLWLANRSKGVGGSDMSAIMGLDRYRTPYELWLDKTGRSEREDISGRWAIIKGNALESELRRWYRARHPGVQVLDGTGFSLTSRAHPHMIASLDGVIWDPDRGPGVLECKTASSYRARDWRSDDGMPVAPAYYMAQVTHYLAVTGWTWGAFVADIGSGEPVEVAFERDEEDVAAVVKAAEEFWGYVERDEPPTLTGSDVERVYPEPEEGVVEADGDGFDQLAADYLDWGEAEADARRHKTEVGERLKAIIGSHEGMADSTYKATFKHYKRPAHMVAESSGRTLRVRKIEGKGK